MTTPTPRTTPCLLPTTFIRQSIIWSVVSGCLWTIVGGAMCYFYFNPIPAVSRCWCSLVLVERWNILAFHNAPGGLKWTNEWNCFLQWCVSSMMEAGKGNYRQGILTQVEWLVIFYHRLRVFPCDIHFCMKIEKTCWKEAFDITQMPSDIRRLTSALVSNPLDDLCIDIWMFVMIISEPRLQRDRIYPLYTEMYYIHLLLILDQVGIGCFCRQLRSESRCNVGAHRLWN